MSYSLGLDIGSVNVKLALLNENGQLAHNDIERITSGPRAAVAPLINRLGQKF